MRVLNVGSGRNSAAMPPWFDGWDVVRLDINPQVMPNILMDARNLGKFDQTFDAVFCSHNLEHYTPHDAGIVVRGMRHVLEKTGFVDIIVPNVGGILEKAALDLDTFLYQSPGGPICVRDVLYGYEKIAEFSDHPEFCTHKNGFSARTLSLLLTWCGFAFTYAVQLEYQLRVVGFLQEPAEERLAEVGL